MRNSIALRLVESGGLFSGENSPFFTYVTKIWFSSYDSCHIKSDIVCDAIHLSYYRLADYDVYNGRRNDCRNDMKM